MQASEHIISDGSLSRCLRIDGTSCRQSKARLFNPAMRLLSKGDQTSMEDPIIDFRLTNGE